MPQLEIGQRVRIEYNGHTVEGLIAFVSAYCVSLVLSFDATID